jgi:hypothetical protein
MILLILEAMLALFILVGIVWWTMFSGRKKGELKRDSTDDLHDDRKPPPS